MSEPRRRRIALPAEDAPAPDRRGCLRLAAILGILAGIPAGIFGIPAAFNLFFDETTVPVGGAYHADALTITVAAVALAEGPPRAVTVTLEVHAEEPWAFDSTGIELELANGERVPPAGSTSLRLDAGARATIPLLFRTASAAEPRALHLGRPDVRFALTEDEP